MPQIKQTSFKVRSNKDEKITILTLDRAEPIIKRYKFIKGFEEGVLDFYSSKIGSGVDFRAKNFDSIENLEKNSLDFYASVKSLYLQDRQQKILNTSKIINTQNDNDWEEFD